LPSVKVSFTEFFVMLNFHHQQEWLNSAVDPDLITLNVRSFSSLAICADYLFYGLASTQRRNDGRLRDKWLYRYAHLDQGGWWCQGVDVLTWQDSIWGCLKPDVPRLNLNKNKPIKYEHPPQTSTELFALQVPRAVWSRIATRWGVPMAGDSFWQWVIAHPEVPLVITEGAKKAGALLTAGYAAVALPGMFGGYRQSRDANGQVIGLPQLIPALQVFAVPGRSVIFAFDEDHKASTRLYGRQAIRKTAQLLQRQGCTCHVMTWTTDHKGIDDLIVAQGVEAAHAAYDAALEVTLWNALQADQLTATVDVEVCDRYLTAVPVPKTAQIVALKSPKGTGKTQWLSTQVAAAIEQGQRVLVLTHRVQLGSALCDRFGIDYITEVQDSDTAGILGYGICADSLHPTSKARFNPADWEGALLIVDEVEQVLWHLLNANTEVKKHRTAVLHTLRELVYHVLAGQGRIFLADADLTDISLRYFTGLVQDWGEPLRPWILVNTWQPAADRALTWYDDPEPTGLIADLERHIAAGGIPFVCTSAQKTKSTWSSRNLERYYRERFPHLQILRIDSESIAEPGHPACGCMAHLNSLLADYDLVIASPSIETGISIDLDHFTSVWGIAGGVQTCDAVRQALSRVRADVPRFLWAKSQAIGVGTIGDGSCYWQQLLQSQRRQTRLHVQTLLAAGCIPALGEDTFHALPLEIWAQRGALINIQARQYATQILAGLLQEGYQLTTVQTHLPTGHPHPVKDTMTQLKTEAYQQDCDAIAQAPDLNDTELQRLQEQRQKTPEERSAQRKAELARRYPGLDVTPELIHKDDRCYFKRLQLHFYFTVGRQYLLERDRQQFDHLRERDPQGRLFEPDFNGSQIAAQVMALERLNISQFLEPGATFTQESIRPWFEMLLHYRRDIKTFLNVTIHEKLKPIQAAQNLLGKMGLKLDFLYRRGKMGEQVRVYGAVVIPDDRDRVFAHWQARDEARCSPTENVAIPA
jgi:hypothetical protein